jgi:CRISPR-associated endoribonuclease Cas6
MRVSLKLSTGVNTKLTANYNYPLSAAIYNLLRLGSQEFSTFLHDRGYKLNGKTYKLFCFALQLGEYSYEKDTIKLLSPQHKLIICSPVIDEFINNFVIGTFEQQKIEIVGNNVKTVFNIELVESIPEIKIEKINKLKLLSPIVISTKKLYKGKLTPYYYRYTDDISEISRIINKNLINKYELITGISGINKEISFSWEEEYIKRADKLNKRLTRKQTIKAGDSSQTDIIGNLLPFNISGDKDLIKTGLDAGFGEKNSLGFGLAQ